jgi:predicted nucleic acid-binding protein
MVEIRQRLERHRLIGLDSSIFIYHFEANLNYLPLTEVILEGVEQGKYEAVTSTVTIMEVTVHPWRADRSAVAREYETLLIHFPNLKVVEATRDVARRAAQLRAKYSIRPADALQVATAAISGATAWVSNDKKLKRLEPEIEVIILEDFI